MRETDPSAASTQIDKFRSTDEQYARKPDPRVGLILDSKYKLIEEITPKAFANFSPAVGAQLQPWD